jgi:hypothetical protein
VGDVERGLVECADQQMCTMKNALVVSTVDPGRCAGLHCRHHEQRISACTVLSI